MTNKIDEDTDDDTENKNSDNQPDKYYIESLLEYYESTQYRKDEDENISLQVNFTSIVSHTCHFCENKFISNNQLHNYLYESCLMKLKQKVSTYIHKFKPASRADLKLNLSDLDESNDLIISNNSEELTAFSIISAGVVMLVVSFMSTSH